MAKFMEHNEHIMTDEEAEEFLADVQDLLAEMAPAGDVEYVTAEQIIAEIDAADDEAN